MTFVFCFSHLLHMTLDIRGMVGESHVGFSPLGAVLLTVLEAAQKAGLEAWLSCWQADLTRTVQHASTE